MRSSNRNLSHRPPLHRSTSNISHSISRSSKPSQCSMTIVHMQRPQRRCRIKLVCVRISYALCWYQGPPWHRPELLCRRCWWRWLYLLSRSCGNDECEGNGRESHTSSFGRSCGDIMLLRKCFARTCWFAGER